jgi:putative oxidoreductase
MNALMYNDALGKLILRLTLGGLMLLHGIAKINKPGTVDYIGNVLSDVGFPSALAYGVYVGEIIAPLMVILGVYCRIGGLVIVVNMIFAILLMHSGDIFSLTKHGGWAIELQAFYLLCGAAVMFLGSGRHAVRPD